MGVKKTMPFTVNLNLPICSGEHRKTIPDGYSLFFVLNPIFTFILLISYTTYIFVYIYYNNLFLGLCASVIAKDRKRYELYSNATPHTLLVEDGWRRFAVAGFGFVWAPNGAHVSSHFDSVYFRLGATK